MKAVFLILGLMLFHLASGQSRQAEVVRKIQLEGKRWKSNIHCFTDPKVEAYELYSVSDTVFFVWGNFISFGDSTFSTSYSASCGNDCFTTVTGTYKYKGVNRIEVYVASISRNGFCLIESEEPKKVFGIYRLQTTLTGLSIQKEKD